MKIVQHKIGFLGPDTTPKGTLEEKNCDIQ